MKSIKEIIKEINLKWNEPHYFVVDTKADKAVITNLAGLCWIASRKGINTQFIQTSDTDVIEHDLGNELESIGIYIEHLQIGDEITYQDIEVVRSISEFIGG